MKVTAASLLCVSLALAGTTGSAQDATKKDGTDKDSGSSMVMTVQQCREHMATSAKAGMKKDDAMVRKDTMCDDLMKKEGPRVTGDAPGERAKK
ncbi:hypothetical protein J7E70_33605 [Variovorax paradoxus]|nr:hypothetical protein [Variovorax paradoxus]MBT2305340.1 hypothetical protein [Variovorax paradoxus]